MERRKEGRNVYVLPSYLLTILPSILLILRDLEARFSEHFLGKLVGVAVFKDEVLDACVDDHLGADAAGLVRAVEGGAVDVRPVLGRLDDRVLLGVEPAADLMPLARGDAELFPEAP